MTRATLFSATLGEDGKVEPPLGPLYIAAAIESIGWTVDFRDFQLCDGANAFEPDTMCRYLEGHARFLLVSCFVDMLPVVIAAAKKLKARRPDSYILLGGPGPSARAAEILAQFPQIDAIVQGEGDETIVEWAKRIAGGAAVDPIPGAVFRHEGFVVEGPARTRIAQSGLTMLPAYHLLDWSKYSGARVITTRGCPYHCSFCDVAPLWGRKAVYRDLENTIDEMVLLRERHDQEMIAIVDDTFVLNRDRVRAFCRMMIERGLDIKWGCFGRINLMSESLIELMARAGCRAIFYGIDSGSPKILAQTAKELDADSILPILALSAQYFDNTEASFIWGYPFETLADFRLTLKMASEASQWSPKVNVQLHMLSPLPNSPLYKGFEGELSYPEEADKNWLLLPALLLDSRAAVVRSIIAEAPHLFPGFFTFPTPAKSAKRAHLRKVLEALHSTIGRAVLDKSVAVLLDREDPACEVRLMSKPTRVADRIGTGLALGFFRRTRAHSAKNPLSGARGAALIRERNDLAGSQSR
jgi:anaerobic magnesium-protoporphyrin IX monomethyl ester cyclase